MVNTIQTWLNMNQVYSIDSNGQYDMSLQSMDLYASIHSLYQEKKTTNSDEPSNRQSQGGDIKGQVEISYTRETSSPSN